MICSSVGLMLKYLHISLYVSLDRAPNILKRALLRANSKECLNVSELVSVQILPTAVLPFFYLNIYYVDSPDCLQLFLSISVFYF